MKVRNIIFLVLSLPAYSQNLIINPGFETNDTLKSNPYSNTNSSTKRFVNWSSANTQGTPDWFINTAIFYGFPKSGDTTQENILPHAGNNFSGISAYYDLPGNIGREYIQGELNKVLDSGAVYKFSVFLAMPSYPLSNYTPDSIGVYFSQNRVKIPGASLIKIYHPQVTLFTSGTFSKNDKWELVTGYFVSNGKEKYFTLGCFQPRPENTNQHDSIINSAGNPNVMTVVNSNSDGYRTPHSYYFIDDVSLTISSSEEWKSSIKFHDGQKFIETTVNFNSGDSSIVMSSSEVLDKIVAQMKVQLDIRVEIDGHTDSIGTASANQKLSEARARAVKKYFVSKGVDASRITTKGFGESMPIGKNPALNRRVEFIFSK